MRKNICLILLLVFLFADGYGQFPLLRHPVSTEAETGFQPCRDTIKILKKKQFYDIGVILPSWMPIVHDTFVAVLEGLVLYDPHDGSDGPHVSHEDLPFYHYSHDMDFNVMPDKTEDNRFTNLTPYLVFEGENNQRDTALRNNIHVEWECGLGMSNWTNPLKKLNNAGLSGGYYSAGHKKTDILWNWPAAGDWVHVEGNYVWDRGHPPAKAEIHPPRFVAVKRLLPDRFEGADKQLKMATRLDIFASGDGGPLMNNRDSVPEYVRRVDMDRKDYELDVNNTLTKPSAAAILKWTIIKRPGDSFNADEVIEQINDSSIHVRIPWHSSQISNTATYARTIYLYWSDDQLIKPNANVNIYQVRLNSLRIVRLGDVVTKAELRLFVNVGSDWIFLNDFYGAKGKILSKGMGKTRKKHWDLNNVFNVCVPNGTPFRVYISGWEVDGVDLLTGQLLDPYSPCNFKTKFFVKSRLFSIQHMLLQGCMDDEYGEVSSLHYPEKLGRTNHFSNSPKGGFNDDPCPFSKWALKDTYFLTYTVEKIN